MDGVVLTLIDRGDVLARRCRRTMLIERLAWAIRHGLELKGARYNKSKRLIIFCRFHRGEKKGGALKRTLLAALLSVTAFALPAAGEPPSTQPDEINTARAAVIGSVSIASIDQFAAFARDAQIPFPPSFNPAVCERFPFVGAGGVRRDLPVGSLVLWGPNVTPIEKNIVGYPVQRGRGMLGDLVLDGHPLQGKHRDVVAMNHIPVRRTDNYLWIGGAEPVIDQISELDIQRPYPGQHLLAAATLNLAAARAIDPEGYDSLWDNQVHGQPAPRNATDAAIADFQRRIEKAVTHNLDTLSFSLRKSSNLLYLGLGVSPLSIPKDAGPEAPFQRPTLPPAAVRIDLAYPSREAAQWWAPLFGPELDEIYRASPRVDADTAAKMSRFASSAFGLLTVADAQSIAVDLQDHAWVIYVVNQYRNDIDFGGEVAKLVKTADEMDRAIHSSFSTFAKSGYDVDGIQAQRLIFLDKRGPAGYFDWIQQGKTVAFTLSNDPGRHVTQLKDLKFTGPLQSLASGTIDLDPVVAASAKQPGSVFSRLSGRQLADLHQLLAPNRLSFSVESKESALNLDVAVPMDLVRHWRQLAAVFAGPTAQGRSKP